MTRSLLVALTLFALARTAAAQVQVRLGDSTRATYSELHEGLRPGTPAADSVRRIMTLREPRELWRRVRAALAGTAPWNEGLLALTRLATLRDRAIADSAARLARDIDRGMAQAPPGIDPADLLGPLTAIRLERQRATRGDAAVGRELLAQVDTGEYGLGEAWVLGRLGAPATDTLRARFLAAQGPEEKVRLLTLLSFASDTASIPLLARIYAAPDSFGVPARYGGRASDALLWIGTRSSLAALRDARERARRNGAYADPRLARGGYDFLAGDSSLVISRTGRWLDDWIDELRPE